MTTIDKRRLTQELAAVVTAIWFDIDHGDGSGVSAHFTPDATLTLNTRSFTGREQLDELYSSRFRRGPRVARHLMTNLHITHVDDRSVAVISSLCLFAEDGEPPRAATMPALVGDVVDQFEQHNGRWLIRSRHIRELFVSSDAVFAVPRT